MVARSPELGWAFGATQSDQKAGEGPWTSPDHLPPPAERDLGTADRWYVGLLVALAGLATLFLVLVFFVHLVFGSERHVARNGLLTSRVSGSPLRGFRPHPAQRGWNCGEPNS